VPPQQQRAIVLVEHRGEHDRGEAQQIMIKPPPAGQFHLGQPELEPGRVDDRLLTQIPAHVRPPNRRT
jgi:hypothetical protein